MEKNTDIATELANISPLLAAWERVNVFTVPEDYFSTFPFQIFTIVSAEEEPLPAKFPGLPATVPEGYFDQVADAVLGRIRSMDTETNDFEVLSPWLRQLQSINVFNTPEHYFEQFPGQLYAGLYAADSRQEIHSISPMLSGLSRQPVFDTPSAYFENLPLTLLQKVSPETQLQAKVVALKPKNRLVLYAVAAMMTGVLALGLYRYFGNEGSPDATIPTAGMAIIVEKGTAMNEQQFNEVLATLSRADIANYLEQNGDITDISALKTNLDEHSLPSEEQYLVDETTLDDYLSKIEQTTLNN